MTSARRRAPSGWKESCPPRSRPPCTRTPWVRRPWPARSSPRWADRAGLARPRYGTERAEQGQGWLELLVQEEHRIGWPGGHRQRGAQGFRRPGRRTAAAQAQFPGVLHAELAEHLLVLRMHLVRHAGGRRDQRDPGQAAAAQLDEPFEHP